jgi:hypothetical protein
MGVKTCSRGDCSNIMCDTYISGAGYVCYDCQNEFIEYAKSKSIGLSYYDMVGHLKEFLLTPKGSSNSEIEEKVKEFFQENTR